MVSHFEHAKGLKVPAFHGGSLRGQVQKLLAKIETLYKDLDAADKWQSRDTAGSRCINCSLWHHWVLRL